MPKATLFDVSTGNRKQVEVGSPNAFATTPEEQKRGVSWKLETPTQNFQTYQNPTKSIQQVPGSPTLYASDTGAAIKNPAELSAMVGTGGYQDNRSLFSGATSPTIPTVPTPPVQKPTPPADFHTSFSNVVQQLLIDAKNGASTENLQTQRDALLNARFRKQVEMTPEQLRVLSPAQQSALRNQDVGGLNDRISEVNRAIGSRKEDYQNALDAVKTSMSVFAEQRKAAADDVALQNSVRDDSRATIKLLWDNYGSEAFAKMSPEERSHYEKIAGFPQGTLDIASDTLAQQKLDKGRYKSIPATKYHGTLTLDTTTGIYVDQNGSAVPESIVKAGGATSGGTGSTTTKYPVGFLAQKDKYLAALRNGDSQWGPAWNALHAAFPTVSTDVIDALLEKEKWYKDAAWEEKQRKLRENPSTAPKSTGGFVPITAPIK